MTVHHNAVMTEVITMTSHAPGQDFGHDFAQ